MKLLLDTHIYLWWLINATALPRRAGELIAEAEAVFVSTVSIWEAGIKWQAGKLPVAPEDLATGIGQCGFAELPVMAPHAVAASRLPLHHRDPFDRMLIAQAMAEPLHFVTSDRALGEYSSLVTIV
ncbi:MAG: type II toxin-antitoxin system VapC family toxin [Burkholderiaceae bacterium]|nr:type II toxin-antitoxin system VapC family toxin [Burkholderiaceae bacterium]